MTAEPVLQTTEPFAGQYQWMWDVYQVPGQPASTPDSEFTLFDIAGINANTLTFQPFSWQSTIEPSGNVADGHNITWQFAGQDLSTDTTFLGLFGYLSSSDTDENSRGISVPIELSHSLEESHVPIPEPSLTALVGSGLTALAAFTIRRRA